MGRSTEELQRIKDAVLAELKKIAPTHEWAEISPRLFIGRSFEDYTCQRMSVTGLATQVFQIEEKLPADDPYWGIAYSVLGLEARAERERAQAMYDALKEVATISIEVHENPDYTFGENDGSMFHRICTRSMDDWKGSQQAKEKEVGNG